MTLPGHGVYVHTLLSLRVQCPYTACLKHVLTLYVSNKHGYTLPSLRVTYQGPCCDSIKCETSSSSDPVIILLCLHVPPKEF